MGDVLKSLSLLTRAGRRRAYLAGLEQTLERDWSHFELGDEAVVDVPCVQCPKFARFPARCTVPFGSRLRSCITASTEFHLRGLAGARVLEVGCGESSFARRVVELGGGTWTGIDQFVGAAGDGYGHSIAARMPHLPFLDESFDVVFGTQVIEHIEDPAMDIGYASALGDVWRLLRPGGWIFFDGPIHLHGAPEFVRGDLARIRAIFGRPAWSDVRLTTWRRKHEPLPKHHAPRHESERWAEILGEGTEREVAELRRRSAWIVAVRATKPVQE
jgi:SAM-dependent methyltransferase